MAQQGEERGNGERFVTFVHHLKVYSMPIVNESEERGDRVDGDHKEDSDDA